MRFQPGFFLQRAAQRGVELGLSRQVSCLRRNVKREEGIERDRLCVEVNIREVTIV